MGKNICIHGHFYQPPRENAWLEDIEIQDSAYPYHDWNERITAESYSPNSAARILSGNKRIIDIVNNYSRISFNFGPTLLSWMEREEPEVYEAILEADKESLKNFSGHGAAIAQVYNHMIMPLANTRDKRTQVYWGIRDFQHRFGRDPEGMWLPETAVDLETLEVLVEFGIRFTILSPYQADKVRKIGKKEWQKADGGKIDPKKPYKCVLPSGQSIIVFFYDGPIAQDVSFGDLLGNGENFAKRLYNAFDNNVEEETNQLVHIATDGETYGHHHSHGDMALAYCLYNIQENDNAELTIYGEYLDNNPPGYEVKIIEESSWSCAHGVERWRSNCGCRMRGDWSQEWRKPLRESLDWLREKLIGIYDQEAVKYFSEPWKTRDEYISPVLNRSDENVHAFLEQESSGTLTSDQKVRALQLLEIQRHAMLMYTSCGWFFDEISGIETTQVIQYASRAIQLAERVTGRQIEDEFIQRLGNAPSNVKEIGDGAAVYTKYIKPAKIDMLRVGAHYAVSSLFGEYPESTIIHCYTAKSEFADQSVAGKLQLRIGRVRIRSKITWKQSLISYAVLYLGDHIINGGVREFNGDIDFEGMHQNIKEAFRKSDISEVFNLMDDLFGTHNYTLWHLFKDEQREVFDQILESSLERIEYSFRQIYDDEYPLMQAMREMGIPLPGPMTTSIEFVFNHDFRNILRQEELDFDRLEDLTEDFRSWEIELDTETLEYEASKRILQLMRDFEETPLDVDTIQTIQQLLHLLQSLPMDLDIWEAQNIYFETGKSRYSELVKQSEEGDMNAERWVEHFRILGDYLNVKVE